MNEQYAWLILLSIPLLIILYILFAMGLSTMINKEYKKGGWIAWVPVLNNYGLGKLAASEKKGIIYASLSFLANYVSNSAYDYEKGIIVNQTAYGMAGLLGIIVLGMGIYLVYKIYKRYSTKYKLMIIFTILSCCLMMPIFIFAIRNNKQVF